jgi:hypothetical protein
LDIPHLKLEAFGVTDTFNFSTDLFFSVSLSIGQGAEVASELSVRDLTAGSGQGGVTRRVRKWSTIGQLVDVRHIGMKVGMQLNPLISCVIPHRRQGVGISLEAARH